MFSTSIAEKSSDHRTSDSREKLWLLWCYGLLYQQKPFFPPVLWSLPSPCSLVPLFSRFFDSCTVVLWFFLPLSQSFVCQLSPVIAEWTAWTAKNLVAWPTMAKFATATQNPRAQRPPHRCSENYAVKTCRTAWNFHQQFLNLQSSYAPRVI